MHNRLRENANQLGTKLVPVKTQIEKTKKGVEAYDEFSEESVRRCVLHLRVPVCLRSQYQDPQVICPNK